MSDFNNRIAAQRSLLEQVNARGWRNEELFGLSSKAIDRWVSTNRLEPDCRLVKLVYSASEKLYFLANKSQEQVSDEYRSLSKDFDSVLRAIETELADETLLPIASGNEGAAPISVRKP